MRDSGKITKRDLDLLSAYLDDELSSKDSAQVESRLAVEPVLKEVYEELRKTRSLLAALPDVRTPRQFTLTPEMVGKRIPARGFPILQFATVAVALAFVVVVGIDFMMVQAPMGAFETNAVMLESVQEQEVEEAKEAASEEAVEDGLAFEEPAAEALPAEAPEAEAPEAEAPTIAGALDEGSPGEEQVPPEEEPLLEAEPSAAEEEAPQEPEESMGVGDSAERSMEVEATEIALENELESEDVEQTFADAVEEVANTPTAEWEADHAVAPDLQPPRSETASSQVGQIALRILEIGLGGLALVLLILTLEARRRG
jgi:anti-sigma factor RsiW